MSFLGFVSYYTRFGLNIMNSYKVNIIIYRTMLSDKVKTKNLKGKQNKKKWKKNIDVSELFDYIQEQNNEARKK